MASYARESGRFETGLPYIRPRSPRARSPRRVVTLEDHTCDADRRVRMSTTGTYYREPADSQVFYPRPPSPSQTRTQVMDLQDQTQFYREEIAKKDRLISQLSTVDTPRTRVFDSTQIEEIYAADRLASSATAKSEIAALSVKVDGLQSQVRELQGQLDQREDKIRQIKLQCETARENEAKYQAMSHSLRQKITQYEAQFGSLEGMASRSEIAVHSLQRENRESQEKILELESRVRSHLAERERAEQERAVLETRLSDLMGPLCGCLLTETYDCYSSIPIDLLIGKVNELLQENAMLRGKVGTMKDYVSSAELETKASRETIMRLATESEREERFKSKYHLDVENLRVERDNAIGKARELEREVDLLKERLESNNRAWQSTRKELEERESHFSTFDIRIRDYELAARNSETGYKAFKEALATILSDGYQRVEPYEEAIREGIQSLVMNSRDKSAHLDMLESKVTGLTDQLEAQYELHRTADRRAQTVSELEERLRRAEGELATGDVLRDGMKHDKERYMRFIEQVSQGLKMDPWAGDMGLDMIIDAILCRIEQLTRLEGDSLVDRKTQVYNLQRKYKALKEQLESKDLHMDLLRKKVTSLEERLVGRSELDRKKKKVPTATLR